MDNYSSVILTDLVGSANYFQFESSLFSGYLQGRAYGPIKKTIESNAEVFKSEIHADLDFIGWHEYSCSISNSDNHNHTKRVLFVENKLSGERLVYKPKHLGVEPEAFKLFDAINNLFLDDILVVPRIRDAKFGYLTEFVERGNNKCLPALLSHIGRLLPVVKILGISDLHLDNLEIRDDKLWILDFESICNFSSARVCILKNYNSCTSYFDEFTLLDSLLLSPKGVGFELDELICQAYGIDDFSFTNKQYYQLVISGIHETIQFISDNQPTFINIVTEYAKKVSFRLILRPTVFYSAIIQKLFTEECFMYSLEDYKTRLIQMLSNANNQVPSTVITAEVEALMIGDIPVFYVFNGTLQTVDRSLCVLEDLSILDIVLNEIKSAQLSEKDYIDYFEQKRLYEAGDTNLSHWCFSKVVSSDVAGLDDSRVHYMGLDMYSGYPGFTLAFFHDEARFKHLYREFIVQLRCITQKGKLNFISLGGAYEGLVSLLYYFILIYREYKDEAVSAFICGELFDTIVYRLMNESHKSELLDGLFGQIAVLDKYLSIFGDERIDAFIKSNLRLDYGIQDVGVAHGLAGQLLMELRLSERYFSLERIKNLQERLSNEYSFEHLNWLDSRTGTYDSYFWCNGGYGISLVLKESQRFNRSAQVAKVLKSIETNRQVNYTYSHLCCGAGLSALHNNSSVKLINYPNEARTGIYNLSFFTGRSGIEFYRRNNLNILLLE